MSSSGGKKKGSDSSTASTIGGKSTVVKAAASTKNQPIGGKLPDPTTSKASAKAAGKGLKTDASGSSSASFASSGAKGAKTNEPSNSFGFADRSELSAGASGVRSGPSDPRQLHSSSRSPSFLTTTLFGSSGASAARLPLSTHYGDDLDVDVYEEEEEEMEVFGDDDLSMRNEYTRRSGPSSSSGASTSARRTAKQVRFQHTEEEEEDEEGGVEETEMEGGDGLQDRQKKAVGRQKSAKNYTCDENLTLCRLVFQYNAWESSVNCADWKVLHTEMGSLGFGRSKTTYYNHYAALLTAVRSASSALSQEKVPLPNTVDGDKLVIEAYCEQCLQKIISMKLGSAKWWSARVVAALLSVVCQGRGKQHNQQNSQGVEETIGAHKSKFAAERQGRAEKLAAQKAAEEERQERLEKQQADITESLSREAEAAQRQAEAATTSAAAITSMSNAIAAIARSQSQGQQGQGQGQGQGQQQGENDAIQALSEKLGAVEQVQQQQNAKLDRLLSHFGVL